MHLVEVDHLSCIIYGWFWKCLDNWASLRVIKSSTSPCILALSGGIIPQMLQLTTSSLKNKMFCRDWGGLSHRKQASTCQLEPLLCALVNWHASRWPISNFFISEEKTITQNYAAQLDPFAASLFLCWFQTIVNVLMQATVKCFRFYHLGIIGRIKGVTGTS